VAPKNLVINVPEQLREGAYSDIVMVWHNQWGFTLDFLTQIGPQTITTEDGQEGTPLQIVSRVRIPPAVIFPLMKALNENLANYERRHGAIAHPRDPDGGDQ
jgi:hypothetical protein